MSTRINKSKYNLNNLKAFLIEKWLVVLILSLFFSGMFLGSFYINHADSEITNKIIEYCKTLISTRASQTSIGIFKNGLVKYFIFIVFTYFLGLCSFGVPLIFFTPLAFGISNGILCGYIYETYSFNGLMYCVSTIYPSLMIVVILLVLGSCESFQMSIDTLKMQTDKSIVATGNLLKKYTYRYLILLGILIVACIFESLLCNLFIVRFALNWHII